MMEVKKRGLATLASIPEDVHRSDGVGSARPAVFWCWTTSPVWPLDDARTALDESDGEMTSRHRSCELELMICAVLLTTEKDA